MVSSKPGAQIQKLEHAADRGTRGGRAVGGAARAALVWSSVPIFDARLRTCTLVPPFAYKRPGISRTQGEEVLRSFSLVLV